MWPQSFIFRASSLLLKKKGSHGNASLFVCFSISLVLQGMSLHPTSGIVLWNPKTLTWPEWEMSPILSPSKEHLCWRSAVRLSFPPVGSRRKHLSPLSSVKIRCLCLFRVEQINCEWSTVGRGARKREGEMVERGEKTTKQLGSQLLACSPCEQMVFTGKPSLLSQENEALTPCYNPPFSYLSCLHVPPACTNPFPLWVCLFNVI